MLTQASLRVLSPTHAARETHIGSRTALPQADSTPVMRSRLRCVLDFVPVPICLAINRFTKLIVIYARKGHLISVAFAENVSHSL